MFTTPTLTVTASDSQRQARDEYAALNGPVLSEIIAATRLDCARAAEALSGMGSDADFARLQAAIVRALTADIAANVAAVPLR